MVVIDHHEKIWNVDIPSESPLVSLSLTIECENNTTTTSGTITAGNSSFQGATTTSQQQFMDFMNAMRTGQIYINIHTEQNPDGEIRGQITAN